VGCEAEACLALAEELSRKVYEVCKACDCLLLSGGVDTSFVAASLARHGHRPRLALTATYKGLGEDVRYASLVAERLGLGHVVVEYGDEEADEALDVVLAALKTFDPVEVRGSLSTYMALREALTKGCRRVATGDGGDELFAGYDFLLSKPQAYVDAWTKSIVGRWRFSSVELGEHLGLEVVPAYANAEVVKLAFKVPYACRVLEAHGRVWGKALLRLWLDREGFKEVAWRRKDPIESGSGSAALSLSWASKTPSEELARLLREEGVNLPSKSHAYLYRRFRELGLDIPRPRPGEEACPVCKARVEERSCRLCGAYIDEEGVVHVYTGP